MYEEDVNDQDLEDEEIDVELYHNEVGDGEPEISDTEIDCLLNVTASSGTTVKIYEDAIGKGDFDSITSFPSANVSIISDFNVSEINDICCGILEDEDASQYTILFMKLSVYDELKSKSNYEVDYDSLLKKEDIEDEISNILSGD